MRSLPAQPIHLQHQSRQHLQWDPTQHPGVMQLILDQPKQTLQAHLKLGLPITYPVSQLLFNQDLPTIPVNYTLSVALNAVFVPEPTMIALIGLGILGIGTAQRRKIRTQLTV